MVGLIVFVVMVGLSSVVALKSKEVLKNEADKLLQVSSARYANFISGIISMSFVSVETTQGVVNGLFANSSLDEDRLLNLISNMVDANPYVTFGYLYLANSDILDTHHNTMSRMGNNEVLMVVDDEALQEPGGTRQIAPNIQILQTQAFAEAVESKKIAFGKPTAMQIAGQDLYALNIVAPLFNNNLLVGVVGIAVDLRVLRDALLGRNRVFSGEVRMLIADDGTIVSHTDEKAVNQTLLDYNKHSQTQAIVKSMQENKNGIFPYYSLASNMPSHAALHNFEIPSMSKHWSIITVVSESVIEEPIYKIIGYIAVVCAVLLIISVVIISLYIKLRVSSRIAGIQDYLFDFFGYLRYEKDNVRDYNVIAYDEIGNMAQAIKENIALIQKGISTDRQVVQESIGAAQNIEVGNFAVKVEGLPNNPELKNLVKVLNGMFEVLRCKVGSDMNVINAVFESYKNLDFTQSIENPKGDVESVTNVLGDEIKAMLKASSSFAQKLTLHTAALRDSMDKLIGASDTQAHSLQQSAAAIEEISSSMQNVNDKTTEVARQAEDIKNIVGVIKDIADQTNL
ncbi:hypothetical protein, partial [Helicobacter sp.]